MNTTQWNNLKAVIDGQRLSPIPSGFIIDSPWLPGWYGISTLDYYTSDQLWFEAHKKAIETFPDTIFLPGFWSEYGMCTEPSAFGAKCRWEEASLPHADIISNDINVISNLRKPDVRKDGLLPFMINRLRNTQPQIHDMGHEIKFAVARGPLNIASFLLGTSELMMVMMTEPETCHKMVDLISDFLVDWLGYQMECFPTIEGILLLDDIIGFVGDDQCQEYVVPYFKKIYGAFDAKINALHNDAPGLVSAPYLSEIGVNLFNFSFEHSMAEMKALTGGGITLLGNIPPRDTLKGGTTDEIKRAVRESVEGVTDRSQIVMSCGGGMPQEVTTEGINAFIDEVKTLQERTT